MRGKSMIGSAAADPPILPLPSDSLAKISKISVASQPNHLSTTYFCTIFPLKTDTISILLLENRTR